jgi:tetratricopeptide (TPR) repeat protein
MPVDWFRTPLWGEQAAAEFEAKLARSRLHNRPQYLRIKAIALEGVGLSNAAKQLLQRIIDDYPDSFDCVFALELRGDMFRRSGDFVTAVDCYRAVIARRPDLNATSGTTPLSLAEVLFELHGASAGQEVRRLLGYSHMRLGFNNEMVRALTLSARVAEAVGNVELRRSEAQRALKLLDAEPQFPRHRTVGVPKIDDTELDELRRLAQADVTPPGPKRGWLRRR